MTQAEIEIYERQVVCQLDGHYCNDWDGLAVSAWTLEYGCCVDFKKTLRGRIVNWFVMRRFYWHERRVLASLRSPYEHDPYGLNEVLAEAGQWQKTS